MKCLAVSTIMLSAAAAALSPAGGPDSPLNVTPKNYTDAEGALLQGFLSLPDNTTTTTTTTTTTAAGGKAKGAPAVIVLHDQDGPTAYEQQRASIFAGRHGYVGFAADIYGVHAEMPAEDASFFERMPFLARYSGNATLFVQRIQAAIDYVQGLEEVDETRVAIVGYCMGGIGVVHYLNHHNELLGSLEGGDDDDDDDDDMLIKGAVAVHPSLTTDGSGPTGPISVPSLFLTGGSDFLTGPDAMAKLESDMKRGSVDTETEWESVRYAKIEHAFSNWFSTGYDARADVRSSHSMMTFLDEAFFGMTDYINQPPTAPEANVVAVDYSDGMYELKGYVSMPEVLGEGDKLPVVIILPHKMDDTGADEYEQQRATQITRDTGFITFVADVYSQDMSGMSADEFEDMYHANHTKYQTRIQAAVNHAKTMDHADPTNIAVIGFGFGGSGALYYGVWEEMDGAVKAVASLHGEMDKVANSTAHLAVTADQPEGASAWGSAGGAGGASWGTGGSEGVDASAWGTGSSEGVDASAWATGGSEGADASAWSAGGSEGGDASAWSAGGSEGGDASAWSAGTSEGTDASSWSVGSSEGEDPSLWSAGSTEGNVTPMDAASGAEDSKGGAERKRQLEGANKPQILIQSGAEDDDMSHVIQVEKVLIGLGANYELTRFSDAEDKFTIWNDDGQDQYDARATARSMDQLYTVLEEVFDTKLSPAIPTDAGVPDFHDGDGHSHGEDGHSHDGDIQSPDDDSSVAATSAGFAFIASAIMGVFILQL